MKKPVLKILLCLLLSFILIACFINPKQITPTLFVQPTSTNAAIPEFQKGIVYTSWWQGEYSSPESDATITEIIKPLGVNWISVVVTCYQQNKDSTDIICKPDAGTPTDDDLVHVIQFIHEQGIKVMLKTHINIISNDDGHWRGDIGFGNDAAAWQVWFNGYTEFIAHYAKLAQNNQVDYFVIGTELVRTSKHVDQWRSVIKKVRSLFNGPITYAANWDEVYEVEWWNDLDAIGVDAYFPLSDTNQPTVAQLKDGWKPIIIQLGQLSKRWDRPIIVTEVGYRSRDGTNRMADNATRTLAIDLEEQADCYEAMFESFQGKEWWRGVYWWNWTPDPTQGGALNDDFTANDKPAEEILRFYFGTP